MFNRLSLVQSIILVVLVAFAVASWGVILIADQQLRKVADRSQAQVYGERIDKIEQYLRERDDLLQATGQRDAYLESFQHSALSSLGRIYDNQPDKDVYLFIMRTDGTVMLHPKLQKGDRSYVNTPFTRTGLRVRNGDFDYDYFGEPKWAIVRTFEPWGWVVGFAVPQEVKYQDALALKKWLASILAVITALTCVGVSFVIWRMMTPVRELTRAAKAVSEGDLEFVPPVAGKGDISILAEAFVTMRSAIRERIESLNHEILERKRTEAMLQESKRAAEAANKAKSMFLANMSHELRTPLNGVVGMLKLLGDTSQTTEQNEYAEMALLSCHRLTNLLGDILDLSRIEAGMMAANNYSFDLASNIQAVNHLFSSAANQAGVELSFELDTRAPAALWGDAQRLQQILNNLVGNALKFTTEGRVTVCVSALPVLRLDERRLLFTVSDTGPGIQEDRVEELFKPFTQAEEDLTRKFQGAGLGLSIVKRLVDMMGGTVCVESEEGVGSTFYVSLPFGIGDPHDEERSDTRKVESRSYDGQKALIVEDDKVNALAVSKYMEKAGFTVWIARNGKEALEVLMSHGFDIVLMDIQMPVMDGVTATRRIRNGEAGESIADIPIIALTAYSMVGDKERFLEAGMSGYLAKPVEIAELMNLIKHVMQK